MLVPYPDGTDKKTGETKFSEGFGHNDAALTANSPAITLDQTIKMLRDDLAPRVATVNRMLKVPATQWIFDAILDAYYNKGNLVRPVIDFLNRGLEESAIAYLRTLNYNDKGERLSGLARRREREIGVWRHGDYGDVSHMKLWRGNPHTTKPEIGNFPEGF